MLASAQNQIAQLKIVAAAAKNITHNKEKITYRVSCVWLLCFSLSFNAIPCVYVFFFFFLLFLFNFRSFRPFNVLQKFRVENWTRRANRKQQFGDHTTQLNTRRADTKSLPKSKKKKQREREKRRKRNEKWKKKESFT